MVLFLIVFFIFQKTFIQTENKIFQGNKEEIYQFSRVDFKETTFDVVKIKAENVNLLKFYYKNEKDEKIESINYLRNSLNKQGKKLLFATNGGIFSEDFKPLGLYVEKGQEISAINLKNGEGNFYLQPNGIFLVQENLAKIVKSSDYQKSDQIKYAVQSGPLLVFENKINPLFQENSTNKYVRNGIGITKNGEIIFAISNQAVNFYDFASFLKEELGCENALYLDGAISEMYVSQKREVTEQNFSVIIGLEK